MKESDIDLFKNDHYLGKTTDLKRKSVKSREHIDCGLLIFCSTDDTIGIFHNPASDIEGTIVDKFLSHVTKDVEQTKFSCVIFNRSRTPNQSHLIHQAERKAGINTERIIDIDITQYVIGDKPYNLEINGEGIFIECGYNKVLLVRLSKLLSKVYS